MVCVLSLNDKVSRSKGLTRDRYPFHLSPMSRQSFRIIQITVSLVLNLHLDTEQGAASYAYALGGDPFEMARVVKRAYLGCYYHSSV
jgi:hypothetical protein